MREAHRFLAILAASWEKQTHRKNVEGIINICWKEKNIRKETTNILHALLAQWHIVQRPEQLGNCFISWTFWWISPITPMLVSTFDDIFKTEKLLPCWLACLHAYTSSRTDGRAGKKKENKKLECNCVAMTKIGKDERTWTIPWIYFALYGFVIPISYCDRILKK